MFAAPVDAGAGLFWHPAIKTTTEAAASTAICLAKALPLKAAHGDTLPRDSREVLGSASAAAYFDSSGKSTR
jgi:hypothetical protein